MYNVCVCSLTIGGVRSIVDGAKITWDLEEIRLKCSKACVDS